MNLKTEAGKNSFYQWDTNQQLIVEDAPDCQEVHFSHRGDPAALVCSIYEADGERVVDVPNILLQQDKPITAYLFSRADDSNQTCHAWSFLVIGRPQPEDYVYTETEVLTYKALEERIIALEENGGSNGISCTHEWNGTVLTITSASGTSSADLKGEKGDTGAKGDKGDKGDTGATGANGKDGADGKTPVKGTDYYTEADKTEMVNSVLAALPTWNGGSY